MTYLNARAKNIGNDQGDVYQYFQNELAHLVQHNGGDHYFNWKTFECTEQTAPHPVGTKTYLRLTTENFDVTQMEKSFITVLFIQWELKPILDLQLRTLMSHRWRNHLLPFH